MHEYLTWLRVHVEEEFNGISYLNACIKLGAKMIDLVHRLHEHGVAHGDIHFENIVFKKPVDHFEEFDIDDFELVLIDFEMAVFFGAEFGKHVKSHRRKDLNGSSCLPGK